MPDESSAIGPVAISIPNTNDAKMEAIVELSKAIHLMAKALTSINTQVTVANNYIQGGVGIDTNS